MRLERRTGRTELLTAVVLEILLLECKEAYARFPLEARYGPIGHGEKGAMHVFRYLAQGI